MLDIKLIIESPNKVKEMLKNRKHNSDVIDEVLKLTDKRKLHIADVEDLRSKRNALSKSFAQSKDDEAKLDKIKREMGIIKEALATKDTALQDIEQKLNALLSILPNMLQEDTPIGKDETENKFIRDWASGREKFDFKAKDHVTIGENLQIIDIKRATKVSGARFNFMVGDGARLERSLINFMLDIHTKEHGYKEILPPFMVNDASMFATGQLPKFKEDLFKIEGLDQYLIPTAEVPLTNYRRNEIIDLKELPLKYVAYTPCFRSEAGSYGKDTRGIIRQHQFNKVELVKIALPEKAREEHEALTRDAEHILQLLKLDYRVISLCSGDIGFGASKCYDLEVYLPSEDRYREISSCSNYGDFQGRRAKIRYKNPKTGKNEFLHTINGSGLAVGRTALSIIDQYQMKNGRVKVPEVLVPYMGKEII